MPILEPTPLLLVLGALAVAAEWLARQRGLRAIGSALIVIALGAIASNAGLIPSASTTAQPVVVYDAIFEVLAPLGIFWLLLSVRLRELRHVGGPLLVLFAAGVVGTALGVLLGARLVDGSTLLGEQSGAVAGMFAGTYTGGSVNFNAVALHYNVMRDGGLYGGLVVVDNIITAVWMGATLLLPRVFGRRTADARVADAIAEPIAEPISPVAPILDVAAETEPVTPRGVLLVLTAGLASLLASDRLAAWFAERALTVPSILILTTIALIVAQSPLASRLRGARVLGMISVLLFLCVIGAYCDVRALRELGALGPSLLALATVTVVVHGATVFGVARLFGMDMAGAAVASQANVGGSTSALALAKALGREELILPGILLGALGSAVGTFVGFAVAGIS